jgi:hypothetical protein
LEKYMLTPNASGLLNIILHNRDMMARLNRVADLFLDGLFGSARWAVLLAPALLSVANPARAADNYVVTETTEEGYADVEEQPLLAAEAAIVAEFGPFRLVGANRVEMEGGVETDTPSRFKAMLSAHPGVRQIDMIDCPGSEDDDANLELARMIRASGVTMHVPSTGSIRSGAVELFLAGAVHNADRGAEVGVHSWKDSDGHEATDYPADDPVHRPYLNFYRDMGMTTDAARAFYDFTNNAASFDDVHYMSVDELRRYGLIDS